MTSNPFANTRATEFSDEQINTLWVDSGSAATIINSDSLLPMIILGGKGSGKTHLLRHASLRARTSLIGESQAAVQDDGYAGIYLRFGGLNASRFSEKHQAPEKWDAVFAYYSELSIAELLLSDFQSLSLIPGENERPIVEQVCSLLDEQFDAPSPTIDSLLQCISAERRKIDIEVNNCAFTRTLDVRIRATPGRLFFGIPTVLVNQIEGISDKHIIYLLDELESLKPNNQRYINTLIREREGPSTIRIGSKLWGHRTKETLAGGEFLKIGSEYESVVLDEIFRKQTTVVKKRFMAELCLRRLSQMPGGSTRKEGRSAAAEIMERYFETNDYSAETLSSIIKNRSHGESAEPYHIRRFLEILNARKDELSKAALSIDRVLTAVRKAEDPLLEKALIYRVYQKLARHALDNQELAEIAKSRESSTTETWKGVANALANHFRADFLDQLLRENKLRTRYVGFTNLVAMSAGLPRNLLIILTHMYRWAVYNSEKPFSSIPISVRSQDQGVREASEWFFVDAREADRESTSVLECVNRVGHLLGQLRFTDKPGECALSSFALQFHSLSGAACRRIRLAVEWSLLIQQPDGHRHKNSGRVLEKFQVNPILAPRWRLSISRRGTFVLPQEHAEAIFGEGYATRDYEAIVNNLVARWNGPGFGSGKAGEARQDDWVG